MKILLFTSSIILSLSVSAQNFKGVAYLPTYRMAHIDEINYGLITHVMASFVNPDPKGNMSFSTDIDYFVTKVHSHNAKAIISIGGGGDYSWGDKYKIYENSADIILFDSSGLHKSLSWNYNWIKSVPSSVTKMLAGNINVDMLENLKEITDIVDVSGDLETDKVKDIIKIKAFLEKIKQIND